LRVRLGTLLHVYLHRRNQYLPYERGYKKHNGSRRGERNPTRFLETKTRAERSARDGPLARQGEHWGLLLRGKKRNYGISKVRIW